MISIADVLNPLIWGVAVLGAVASLFIASRPGRELRLTAAALLALAALILLAAVAVAAWLPPQALVTNPDGSTGDPRAASAAIVGLAALLALVTALRSLRLPSLGMLSLLLPGIGLAGLIGAVSYFVGLRAPIALLGLALAGIALGTGLVLFARLRWTGPGVFALQMSATGLLLVGAVLSLHGARAESVRFAEGAVVDTLGCRVALSTVQAPNDSLRRLEFTIMNGAKRSHVWTSLEGRAGTENRAVVGGDLFGGLLVAPLGLDEAQPQAHDVIWLSKGDSTRAGASTVTFVGFRMVPGDTVRMLADLDVTTAGRTQRVSPGMYATPQGTTPFAAVAEGLGPIAVGKVDADNGRIALMLPTPSTSAVTRTATVNLHTRPALPWAWAGGALVALAFLLGFAAPPGRAREPA